jgi:hypothetical protein
VSEDDQIDALLNQNSSLQHSHTLVVLRPLPTSSSPLPLLLLPLLLLGLLLVLPACVGGFRRRLAVVVVKLRSSTPVLAPSPSPGLETLAEVAACAASRDGRPECGAAGDRGPAPPPAPLPPPPPTTATGVGGGPPPPLRTKPLTSFSSLSTCTARRLFVVLLLRLAFCPPGCGAASAPDGRGESLAAPPPFSWTVLTRLPTAAGPCCSTCRPLPIRASPASILCAGDLDC